MGHHSVVTTVIAIIDLITAIHQQVTRTRIAAVEGLVQAAHLVSANQACDNHRLIGLSRAIVNASVSIGL